MFPFMRPGATIDAQRPTVIEFLPAVVLCLLCRRENIVPLIRVANGPLLEDGSGWEYALESRLCVPCLRRALELAGEPAPPAELPSASTTPSPA